MTRDVVTLAPGFLIAAPPLHDPHFDRAVVLLALHSSQEGSLGFVLNRPSDMTVGELLSCAGYDAIESQTNALVFRGGPVQPGSAWVLSWADQFPNRHEAMIVLSERARIASSKEALDELARQLSTEEKPKAERDKRVILGYAGWAPGQLEKEIAQGAWIPIPFHEELLRTAGDEHQWERACAVAGVTPAGMMTMRLSGQAQHFN